MIRPVIQNAEFSICEVNCDICNRTSKIYVDHQNVIKEEYKFDVRIDIHQREFVLLVSCAYCPRMMKVNVSQK